LALPPAPRPRPRHATTAAILLVLLAATALAFQWGRSDGAEAALSPGIPDTQPTQVRVSIAEPAQFDDTQAARGLSAGCSNGAPQAAAGTTVQAFKSGPIDRSYRVHVPVAVQRPAPVIINLHGRYSNGEYQERYSGFLPASDREGFLLVSPDGTGAIRGWSAGATTGSSVDDVAFLGDLISRLEQQYCLDTGRVFIAGMSNGAFMAALAGCRLGNRVAAIAMVAGTAGPSLPCKGATPVIAFHGTDDTIVPFRAGRVRGTMAYPGASAAMAAWAAQNDCGANPEDAPTSDHVMRFVYGGCDAKTEFVVIHGGGHTWPGATPNRDLGPTTSELNAAEVSWAFFESVAAE